MKYEEELWGKVDILHERYRRKNTYLSNFIELVTKYQNSCLNFSQSLFAILNKNYQLIENNGNSIYNAIDSLLLFIRLQASEFNELFTQIKKNILENITKSLEESNHKEKELYSSFTKTRGQYNSSKIAVEKNRYDYHNSLVLCENTIHTIKSQEFNPLAIIESKEKDKNMKKFYASINNGKALETKYNKSIDDAEKLRVTRNSLEKEILNFYQTVDNDSYIKVKSMIGIFLGFNKKMYKSIFDNMEILSTQYQGINIKKDLNDFIQTNKSQNKPEDAITFIPYNPSASLRTTSITGEANENEKLIVDFGVISKLREYFKDICSDLNMEDETKKYRLRILTLKIFKTGPNIVFTQEEKDELISLLKVPQYRTYFIISLSKQRTNGRYKREKKLVDDLADILKLILDLSEKENNYEDAKNCLILSQTFYTEISDGKSKEKYKKYLFDYISDNKWLTSIDFWLGIIEFMIQKDIQKYEELNPNSITQETEDEKRERISNISFTQLLSYANNMLEFHLPKDEVLKVVDHFVEKYNITKQMADTIYDTIKNSIEGAIKKSKTRLNTKIIRKVKARNTLQINLKDLIVDFEVVEEKEKKKRKNKSIKEYKTSLRFKESKFKYIRKNDLSTKLLGDDNKDESDESNSNSFNSGKINLVLKEKNSSSFTRLKSFDNDDNHNKEPEINKLNPIIRFDSDLNKINLEKMDNNIKNQLKNNEINNLNQNNNDNNNIIINDKNIIQDSFNNKDNKIKEAENIINEENKINENQTKEDQISEDKKINEIKVIEEKVLVEKTENQMTDNQSPDIQKNENNQTTDNNQTIENNNTNKIETENIIRENNEDNKNEN